MWFKVPGSKPHLVGLWETGKKLPQLEQPGFFFYFWYQSHKPPLDLAKHNSSPLQYVFSTSRLLRRVPQTEFEARKGEQKTQTCSSHTPCSFLIALLVAHTHGKGATRHQSYWPCDKAAKAAACESEGPFDPKLAREPGQAAIYKHLEDPHCPDTSSLRAGESPQECTPGKETSRELSSHPHSCLSRAVLHLEPGS